MSLQSNILRISDDKIERLEMVPFIDNSVSHSWQILLDTAVRIFHVSHGFILRFVDDGMKVLLSSGKDSSVFYPGRYIVHNAVTVKERMTTDSTMLPLLNSITTFDKNVKEAHLVSFLGIPIFSPEGTMFGILCVADQHKRKFYRDYIELFNYFSSVLQEDLKRRKLFPSERKTAVFNTSWFRRWNSRLRKDIKSSI